jgi:tryptophanyl-tRNA synthetase
MSKSTTFSALTPSGKVTLGNYLGAITNWVKLQDTHNSIYCLVDLHAMTNNPDPKILNEYSYEAVAIYLAAGLDPDKSILFAQSHVSAHAELAWILTCLSSMGELNRMTQFKDKSAKKKQVSTGLFTYPLLMASDILLYQTDVVPVGADQKQHIELSRDLAQRFNSRYKEDFFTIPEPEIPKIGARIMSLSDPSSKMSKSDEDQWATVFISDDEKTTLKKFKKAVTDSETEIRYDEEKKPGVSNLLGIQSAFMGKGIDEIVSSYEGKMYGHLKVETGELVNESLKKVREDYQRYIQDKGELDRILKSGASKAKEIADKTLQEVYELVGFPVSRA